MIHSVHVLFLPEHPSCLASYLPLNGSFLGQWGIVSGFEVSVQDVSMAAVPPSAPFRCEFFFLQVFQTKGRRQAWEWRLRHQKMVIYRNWLWLLHFSMLQDLRCVGSDILRTDLTKFPAESLSKHTGVSENEAPPIKRGLSWFISNFLIKKNLDHHGPSIFPSCSHHVPIMFPSFWPIAFPSCSHHVPIILTHRAPIMFPKYVPHFTVLFYGHPHLEELQDLPSQDVVRVLRSGDVGMVSMTSPLGKPEMAGTIWLFNIAMV